MQSVLLLLALCVTPADAALIEADRARLESLEVPWTVYLTTTHLEGEARTKTEAAAAFIVCASSRQHIIERSTPVEIAEGICRVNIFDLKWDWHAWQKLIKTYPYHTGHEPPYVIRSDWLTLQLSDTTENQAYYALLFDDPKLDRAGFLKFAGANLDDATHMGQVARKQAGSPNVAGTRWVEVLPNNLGGYAFFTRDSSKLNFKSDPLESPDGSFQHEAEEHLAPITKISVTTGTRGFLLAAFLCDAQGKRQEEAPPKIVSDHQAFRGQYAIRNSGSCWACHPKGIVTPGVNELRDYLKDGIELASYDKKTAEKIQIQHLSNSAKAILRAQEDYEATILEINGLSGADNSQAFASAIEMYDADLDLARAAAEVYREPEELRLALAYASSQGRKIGARLAGLPSDKVISRAAWEGGGWYLAYQAVYEWERKSK